MTKDNLDHFIEHIPKAELHLHIEGTFEPEQMFKIAERNNLKIKYKSVEEVKSAYEFKDLQEFLDIYYAGANVLITEQDFYDLTMGYFIKIFKQNVLHTEIMFDPQAHINRGIKFSTVINGIRNAQVKAKDDFGISSTLIMNFLRHLDEDSAFMTLEQSDEYSEWITAVGLDSSELGNPPSKFKNVFNEAKMRGFKIVAHAGEEGPADYVWEALEMLGVHRIDHGNRSLEDDKLIDVLVKRKMPLTVCPLSNVKLKNVKKIENHPLKIMLDKELVVTINSDDPAYFGGYMNENYKAITDALSLSKEDLFKLTSNAFNASFIDQNNKNIMISKLNAFYENYNR